MYSDSLMVVNGNVGSNFHREITVIEHILFSSQCGPICLSSKYFRIY